MSTASPDPITTAARCALNASGVLAQYEQHPEQASEHLLAVLLCAPAISSLLRRVGVDVPRLARTLRTWLLTRYQSDGLVTLEAAPFRTGVRQPTSSPQPTSGFRRDVGCALSHADRAGRIDAVSLLLGILASEARPPGWLARLLRREHALPEAGPGTWLTAHGASWQAVIPAAIQARNAGNVDEVAHAAPGEGVAVVLHDDDATAMQFVVEVVVRETGRTPAEAAWLTCCVNEAGRVVVARGPLDDAHATRARFESAARAAGFPLRVTVEE